MTAFSPRRGRPGRVFLVGVGIAAAVALAIRAYGVLVYRDPFRVWGDSAYYHLQARALADGLGFVDPIRYYFFDTVEPTAGHPPLYSLYLSVWSLLGIDGPTGHRLASALLGAATVVMIGFVGRRVAGDRAGIVAAVVAAVYPPLFVNDYMLMSETMAAFGVALALLACYRFWDSPGWPNALLMGGAVGVATLGRAEVALLFPFVLLPFCLLVRRCTRGDRLRNLVAAGVVGAVVVLPWVGYNLARFEEPTLLSNGFGASFSAASCDGTWSGDFLGYYGCGYQATEDQVVLEPVRNGLLGPSIPGDESERDVVVRELALEYTTDHLDELPKVVAARVGRLWQVFRPGQNVDFDGALEGRGIGAAQLSLVGYYLLMPFAVGGLVVMRRRRRPILPILVLAALVTLAAATTFGVLRYRVPADVGIVVAAAVGIDAVIGWARRRSGTRPETP